MDRTFAETDDARTDACAECWQSPETDVFWTVIDLPHRRGLGRGYRSGCRGADVGVCAAAG